jgi:hypothetical protein
VYRFTVMLARVHDNIAYMLLPSPLALSLLHDTHCPAVVAFLYVATALDEQEEDDV